MTPGEKQMIANLVMGFIAVIFLIAAMWAIVWALFG